MLILSVKERWGKLILKNQNWNATIETEQSFCPKMRGSYQNRTLKIFKK